MAGPALPHNGEDASVLALAFDKQPLAGQVVAGGEHVPGNLIKLVGDRDEICRAVAPQRLKYPVAKRRRPFRLRLAALVLPRCNIAAMNLHLAEIAMAVAPGAHAVLVLDQAGWHLSDKLIVPPNITLVPLPPKCPELNPVENIWQFIRDNWLSNRVFRSYDDILEHCCFAWNKLVDQPWTIMSIGLRDWAHRF